MICSRVPVGKQLRLLSRLQPLDPSSGRRPVLLEASMFLPYFTVAAVAAARTGCQLGARKELRLPEDQRTLPMFCWMCRRAAGTEFP